VIGAPAANAGRGKVALVTGANSGLGLATCRSLAGIGFDVLLGARNVERGAAAAAALHDEGLNVTLQLIDITDDASVEQATGAIKQRFGRLDVLVNNAAVKYEFSPATPSRTPLSTVRDTYETNVFGTIRVIQSMMALLRAADAARIVNVTSGLGSLTWTTDLDSPYSSATLLGYNTAKSALNAVTVQFANELRNTDIKVNCADPGSVDTAMNPRATRQPNESVSPIVWLATLGPDGPTGGFFNEDGPVPW
jgi:NAD(P)-dependent dehydrogenase (short-subunit alcohol dehydrogenase family)